MIVALDADFLLQLSDADKDAWAIYTALLENEKLFTLVTTPSARDLLDVAAQRGEEKTSRLAFSASEALDAEWKIRSVGLDESQRKISWIVGYHFRQTKLMDESLRVESELLAEAVLVADILLVPEDSPFDKLDQRRLMLEMRFLGMSPALIFTPSALSRALSK